VLREFKDDFKIIFRYTQLFPLCFAVLVSMLGFGLVMPLLPIYARNFGATGMQLGFLTAAFAVARIVTTFPGGWLADKMGRKKPIILGLLAYSVVMSLYGFSTDVNQLILFRTLQGMASGVVWPIMSTMVVDMVLPKDRGKAMGLYEMMWFLGMVIGPGLGGTLSGLFTIAVPFFVCGALAFVSTILVAFTVQETITHEENMNALQAESSISNEPASEESPSSGLGMGQLTPYVGIFVGLCIARFLLAFSNSLIQPVLSVYANEELGISEFGVGMLFTVQGVVTLFATLPMGTVADKTGRKPMITLGQMFDAASAIFIIFSGSFLPLLLAMMVRGYGRAVSNPSIVAMFSGLVPFSKRGRGMGVFNIFQNVGLVLGATVGGFLYDFSSSEIPFIACAIASFVGVLVVLIMVSEPKQSLN